MTHIFHLHLPILFALAVTVASGQSFTAFDPDAAQFPTMKARFYAYNSAREIFRPGPSELRIIEDGTPRTVTRVNCPGSGLPQPISSVLTIDISGSMTLPGSDGLPFIDIAKKIALQWIDELPDGASECALTSFDDRSYLNADYTADKQRLHGAVAGLAPRGGTNYNRGLFLPVAGSLEVSKRGTHRRVIVFITDGFPDEEPDVAAIIAEARRQQCPIYALTLGIRCPESLREIARETGGRWFEQLLTFEQVRDVCRRVAFEAQAVTPCEVEWLSESDCEAAGQRTVALTLLPLDSVQTLRYALPSAGIRRLECSPQSVSFIGKSPGASYDTTLTITAHNSDFTVSDIRPGNAAYSVQPANFTLKTGTSRTLTVTFTPADSNYSFCVFDISTPECPAQKFYASSGFPGRKVKIPTLKVTHPNGGEVLPAGRDTVITWSGIVPSDTVRIEVSSDGGSTWGIVSDSASGLFHRWQNVPNISGDRYLVRVRQLGGIDKSGYSSLLLGGHGDEILAVDVSANGGQIVTGSRDGTAAVWDASTGALIQTLRGHTAPVTGVSFNPNGKSIATSSTDTRVMIWDASTGERNAVIREHYSRVNGVAWSPDGTKLASCAQDNSVIIWDESGNLLRQLRGHTGGVLCVAWSPDGTKLVSGSWDNTATIWDAANGLPLSKLAAHPGSVLCAAWSGDGSVIATGSTDSRIRLWDSGNGSIVRTLGNHKAAVTGVVWNGRRLASCSEDMSVALWDEQSWQPAFFQGHTRYVNAVAWRGVTLCSGSGDFSAIVWNEATGQKLSTLQGHAYDVSAVAWSPDGKLLATGSWDNSIMLWNTENGASVARLTGHSAQITDLAFSPDGGRIASSSADGLAIIWDAKAGSVLVTLTAHAKNVNAVTWSPDGSRVITGSSDKKAILWNAFTGQPLQTLTFFDDMITAAAWSPDGTRIAFGVTDSVFIYSMSEGDTVCTLFGLSGPVKRVAWSFDNSRLAGVGDNIYAVVWDINSCSEILRTMGAAPLTGITWHPDATAYATSSSDNSIELWDALTGHFIKKYAGHIERAECVAWSPDGLSVASGSADNTARIWRLNGAKLVLQTDVSDSLWSIAAPAPEAGNINVGQALVRSTKDTIIRNYLKNNGRFTFAVADIRFAGTEADEFSIVAGHPPFDVAPGEIRPNIEIRFRPKATGIRMADVLFILASGDTLRRTILGKGIAGNIDLLTQVIDFETVELGAAKDTLVTLILRNTGAAPVSFSVPVIRLPDATQFSVVNPEPFTLAPFASLSLTLKFAPTRAVRTTAVLSLPFDGTGSPAEVLLYGEGVIPRVRIAGDSARPGQTVLLKLLWEGGAQTQRTTAARAYRATISYRSDLLSIEGAAAKVSRENNTETIVVEGIWNNQGNVIAQLRMRAGLGADTVTPLKLERFEWIGAGVGGSTDVPAETEDGVFKLLGVCYAGGARLFSSNGTIRLAAAVQQKTLLTTAESIERGAGTILVYDSYGREILRPFDGFLTPGIMTLNTDISLLAAGKYFIIFTTPSERLMLPVEVGR